jgi:hypothetical protein
MHVMSEDTDLETALCVDCGIPVEKPAQIASPFMFLQFVEAPRCKDCQMKAREKQADDYFQNLRFIPRPYKITRKPKGTGYVV